MSPIRTAAVVAVLMTLGGATAAQQKPEASSLDGKPLYRITLPDQPKLEANLAQAGGSVENETSDIDSFFESPENFGDR